MISPSHQEEQVAEKLTRMVFDYADECITQSPGLSTAIAPADFRFPLVDVQFERVSAKKEIPNQLD